ncbi:MAG: hypothetical protein ABH883_04280, partial [Candidatus Omnitrophota bacterium]
MEVIKNTVSEIKGLQGRLIDNRVDNFLKMKQILTPEQFQKLSSLMKEKMHSKMGHKKRGGRGGEKQ